MTLMKPQTEDDLLPPITVIGEPGWDARLRAWLDDFDFRFDEPSTEAELAEAEVRLGVCLPQEWRAFLLVFGPANLDGVRLSPPSQIASMNDVWFKSHLTTDVQELLPNLLQMGECGSDNYVVYSTTDGWIAECSHDPGGLWDWCPTFSDFLRISLIRLWSGYYGWPSDDIQVMSEGLVGRWLNVWAQQRQA